MERSATAVGAHPLTGVRVLDLTRLLPGPYLSLVLADLGADVVKVEAPAGGDWVRYIPPLSGGISAQFVALNRGKRSLTLNLKKPGGAEVLSRLAESADVLLESFRPGVMDRLGVGWASLRRRNPRLVYAAITGYGQTGPYRDRAGHDLNYVGLSGALALTGPEGGAPQQPGFQLADIAGGALYGAIGVLSALYAREQTGEGRFLDISMTEGALAFNVLTLASSLHPRGRVQTRGTDQLNGAVACYQVYETSDGGYLSVAPLEPKFWAAFCAAVERPDWRNRHMGQDAAMKSEIATLIASRTRAEWVERFAQIDACVEPILELDELPGHPQHAARGVFFDLQQPGAAEPLRQFRTPMLDPGAVGDVGPAPRLGEHTAVVLTESGFSADEVDELLARSVVTQV